MYVRNIHERQLPADREAVGALIDSLAAPLDALWPIHSWPRMRFDRPLREGAVGGHGPIRYIVESYVPGRSIRFRFIAPKGFIGVHGYEVLECADSSLVLRHELQMTTQGLAVLSWPLVFRPMHDALIEDSLASAESALGLTPTVYAWSSWVKFLRQVISRGAARPQMVPNNQGQVHP